MSTLKVTCAEKYVLIDQAFQFDFPVQYSEFQQLDQEQFQTQVHDQDVIIISDLNVNEQVLANNPNLKLSHSAQLALTTSICLYSNNMAFKFVISVAMQAMPLLNMRSLND
jgi:hypothetical protein